MGCDFDHYRDVSPRFCSEFGFQSYPLMDVIRRFADRAEGIALRAVNDTRAPVALTVTARAARMDGTTRPLAEARPTVGTGAAVEALRLAPDALAVDEVLVFAWSGGAQGGDVFAPQPWKSYALLPSGLIATATPTALTREVTALAPFVAVEADAPGRFSANAVTLFPGDPATIAFTPRDPCATPRFTGRSLHSATYGAPALTVSP